MGVKVTEAERVLIEELLEQYKPEAVAKIVGRGLRTVYYIASEKRRYSTISLKQKPFFVRLLNKITKGDNYEEINTAGKRTQGGTNI